MGLGLRTAATVALLIAFPTLMVGLLGLLALLEVAAFHQSGFVAVKLALFTVPAAIVVLKGLTTLAARIEIPEEGTPLTESAQPELWRLVRRLAEVAGTRPPDQIYLTADVNAAVLEETRLMGLLSRNRRMYIGAPLVAGLRADQLAAVLTHELAHYSNRDTRLSGMVYRGRRAVLITVSGLDTSDLFQRMLGWLLVGYLKLYLRVSSAVCRRQEQAADEAAARAAGSEAAAGALRELAALDLSWDRFRDDYLVLGWQPGYLPADIFGGYAEYRAASAEQLDEVRANPPAETSPYDSHPPLAARVAALDAIGAPPVVELATHPAGDLLRDAPDVLDAALMAALIPEARHKQRTDWATLARLHGASVATAEAFDTLECAGAMHGRRGAASLRTVLDALDAGRLADLSSYRRPLPGDAGSRARLDIVRERVRDGLAASVRVALADVGAARWDLSWESGIELTVDEPYRAELMPLIDAAVAEPPDTAGLRALLDRAGIDIDHRVPLTTPKAAGR